MTNSSTGPIHDEMLALSAVVSHTDPVLSSRVCLSRMRSSYRACKLF